MVMLGNLSENWKILLNNKKQERSKSIMCPKKNLLYERFEFLSYKQTTDTTEQYVTELTNKANTCELREL